MTLDEWHEQAARAAYKAHCDHYAHITTWGELSPGAQVVWLNIARAVLAEGRIEVRPSTEFAEIETREQNEYLKQRIQQWQQDALGYRDLAYELQSQLAGVRRAYDHACEQRDKYMRRTAEWRSAALDGFDTSENDAVVMLEKARALHGPVTIEGRLSPCCKTSHGPAWVSWPCVDARALGMVDEDDA